MRSYAGWLGASGSKEARAELPRVLQEMDTFEKQLAYMQERGAGRTNLENRLQTVRQAMQTAQGADLQAYQAEEEQLARMLQRESELSPQWQRIQQAEARDRSVKEAQATALEAARQQAVQTFFSQDEAQPEAQKTLSLQEQVMSPQFAKNLRTVTSNAATTIEAYMTDLPALPATRIDTRKSQAAPEDVVITPDSPYVGNEHAQAQKQAQQVASALGRPSPIDSPSIRLGNVMHSLMDEFTQEMAKSADPAKLLKDKDFSAALASRILDGGTLTLGSYQLDKDGKVQWVDSAPVDIQTYLAEQGIRLERNQEGQYELISSKDRSLKQKYAQWTVGGGLRGMAEAMLDPSKYEILMAEGIGYGGSMRGKIDAKHSAVYQPQDPVTEKYVSDKSARLKPDVIVRDKATGGVIIGDWKSEDMGARMGLYQTLIYAKQLESLARQGDSAYSDFGE